MRSTSWPILPSRLSFLPRALFFFFFFGDCSAGAVLIQSLPWRDVACPARCACQIKPWFSPVESVYREAPTVDCNALLLAQLPFPLPPDTHTLRLQSNNLLSGCLESPALRALPNLTELDLSQNRLGRVGVGAAAATTAQNLSLPSLQSLHLEENRLARLPHGSFRFAPALQELFLSHNRLRWLAPGAFAGLDSLLRLHVDNNRLRSVDPRWFAALPRLEVLMLGGNPVEALPERGFRSLGSSLRSLVLGGMGLRALAENALDGLDRLESLSFYDNLLTRVPHAALRRVPGLKFLDLNKNRIRLLETGDFRDMAHLKELGLSNMEALVSVERAALDNLPELTKLEITNNPRLSYVHPHAFLRLGRLESLMLNSNALGALHGHTLRSLPSLQEVSLHSNPLRCDCLFRWAAAEESSRPHATATAAAADEVAPTQAAGRRPDAAASWPPPRAVRFIQPRATLCSEPPELRARRVRDVSANEMSASCLPAIAPGTLPPRVGVREGGSLALHCRALAEPQPRLYWVTPSGLRLGPATDGGHDDEADNNKTDPPTAHLLPTDHDAASNLTTNISGGPYYSSGNYRLLAEGTLEISAVTAGEAGLYTCVAENALGADTRSVAVGLRGGGGAATRGRKTTRTRTYYYPILEVREVGQHYAVLSWQSGRNSGLPSTRLSWQAVSDYDARGGGGGRPTAYTTRILAGTQSFNLTHLRAETFYRVCLHLGGGASRGGGGGDLSEEERAARRRNRRAMRESSSTAASSPPPPHHRCVTIRTKVAPPPPPPPEEEEPRPPRLLPPSPSMPRVAMTAFAFYTPHVTLLLCAGLFVWVMTCYRPDVAMDPEAEMKYLEALQQELEARGMLEPEGGGGETTLCGCACVSLDCCSSEGPEEKEKPAQQPPQQQQSEKKKAALLHQEC